MYTFLKIFQDSIQHGPNPTAFNQDSFRSETVSEISGELDLCCLRRADCRFTQPGGPWFCGMQASKPENVGNLKALLAFSRIFWSGFLWQWWITHCNMLRCFRSIWQCRSMPLFLEIDFHIRLYSKFPATGTRAHGWKWLVNGCLPSPMPRAQLTLTSSGKTR